MKKINEQTLRKVLSVVLVLAMVFSLAGCGKGEGSKTGDKGG